MLLRTQEYSAVCTFLYPIDQFSSFKCSIFKIQLTYLTRWLDNYQLINYYKINHSINKEFEMTVQKKSWETPQLIILAKGTPEENVLLHCKAISYPYPAPYSQQLGQTGCDQPEGTGQDKGECGNCQARPGIES
jgi:hypothetical protein